MSRVKPNKAQAIFHAPGHPLSEEARGKLVELLGYGKNYDFRAEALRHQMPGMKVLKSEPGVPLLLGRDPDFKPGNLVDIGVIVSRIENALGLYIHGHEHLDDTPRSAHYVAEFKPVRDDSMRLLKTIAGWTEYFRDQFKAQDEDIYKIEIALMTLCSVANKVLKEHEGKSSKGAKKNVALTEVIRRLRGIFSEGYKGPEGDRPKKGAFAFRSEREHRELEFVKTALVDARIVPKSYRQLPTLFLDPRCKVSPQE